LDPQIIHSLTSSNTDQTHVTERPYYKYLYYTFGLIEKQLVVNYFDSIENYDTFIEAWSTFGSFIQSINTKSKKQVQVPTVYQHLNSSNNNTWITSLLRLLKSGTLSSSTATIPPAEILNYFNEITDQEEDMSMYKTHIHPNLAKDAVELMKRRDGIIPIMNKIRSHQAPESVRPVKTHPKKRTHQAPF